MATSTIKVMNSAQDVVAYDRNAGFCSDAVARSRRYGKVVQVRIEFQGTQAEWGAGTNLFVGNLSGNVPSMVTYLPVMRQDTGLAIGWLTVGTVSPAAMNFYSLTTIPQGVNLICCGTYICN